MMMMRYVLQLNVWLSLGLGQFHFLNPGAVRLSWYRGKTGFSSILLRICLFKIDVRTSKHILSDDVDVNDYSMMQNDAE